MDERRQLDRPSVSVACQPARADHAPVRVLVADDNLINQHVAVRMLERLGLRADVSANGHEAVEMLRRLPYDLVLMDCEMPIMNGQDAVIEIRKCETSQKRTPIVAMTAEGCADCLHGCLAGNLDDMLRKPIRMEELTAALYRWLPGMRLLSQIRHAR
jgi:CheY-like chemotaxis protein